MIETTEERLERKIKEKQAYLDECDLLCVRDYGAELTLADLKRSLASVRAARRLEGTPNG